MGNFDQSFGVIHVDAGPASISVLKISCFTQEKKLKHNTYIDNEPKGR